MEGNIENEINVDTSLDEKKHDTASHDGGAEQLALTTARDMEGNIDNKINVDSSLEEKTMTLPVMMVVQSNSN